MSREVRLRLLWHPQAQFIGYLLAEHSGIARRRGIALTCEPIDFRQGGMAALLEGACDLAIASPAHLVESTAPERLAFLMAVQQASPLVYPVRRSSGITSPAGLAGRTAAVWPGGEDLEFRWMLRKAGLDPARVRRLPTADTVEALVSGAADCAQMTIYHELHEMEHRGLPLDAVTLFRPDDYGAMLLKDGVIARSDWIGVEDALLQDLVEVFLEGWQRAFSDPDEAVALCCKLRPDMSEAHHRTQLGHMRDLAASGPALTQGFAVPDALHVRRALDAMEEVDGHAPAVEPEHIAVARYWAAAPAALKAMAWA
ncbi:ABC transporter substrate-binding protein [Ancylobacter terrae]|uniref:ABC transporter substrate-binding protein n=1 Tax=Ancylobacter sp. sgz301288 TaxID=3342077 RepID=UPI00385A478C